MANIINIALRGLQIFFAVLILGLSGHLVASQAYGGAPSVTNYEVFLGIWLLVLSFVGIAGDFIGALGGVIGVALDALTVLFTFAGGVAMAAKLGVHSCSCALANQSCAYLVGNVVINGGVDAHGKVNLFVNRVNRCREAQAVTAFVWFAFAVACVLAGISTLGWRKGGVR